MHDLLFQPVFIFVIIELHTRRMVHTAVTGSPSDAWTAQQLREATPWANRPKYLIRDRDDKYGPLFLNVATATGIKLLKTPVRAPRANAIRERLIGSLERECLDHMLIWHSAQLHRIVRAYVDYSPPSRYRTTPARPLSPGLSALNRFHHRPTSAERSAPRLCAGSISALSLSQVRSLLRPATHILLMACLRLSVLPD